MKRKTKDTPTRTYSYGCLPPTKGREVLDEQLRLANDYRNKLVEIEHRYRDRVQEAMRSAPEVAETTARVDALDAALRGVRSTIGAKRKEGGRSTDTSAEAAEAGALIAELRQARGALREAKLRARGDEQLQQRLRAAEDHRREDIRNARKASGVYWGTYLYVDDTIDQARRKPTPPRFRRYDGSGCIAVQLQKGISVARLFGGKDRRLRIAPLPEGVYDLTRHQRRRATRTTMWIRTGTGTEENPRDPRWIEFPIILHRPLPSDALIKWARVSRRAIGRFHEYQLQLVVESASFRPAAAPAGTGTVAIDLGWRNKPDGKIRVAYWLDDRGNSGEILVPTRTQDGNAKADELKSIRNAAFIDAREALHTWRRACSMAPQWLAELTEHIDQWCGPARLAAVVDQWTQRRFDGDEAIYSMLAQWAKQERHLRWWEIHQRGRRARHRREEYRRFATHLARTYATIVLEKFDLQSVITTPNAEAGARAIGRAQRRTAKLAAPGELRQAIKDAAIKRGATIVELSAMHTTQTCSSCGVCEPFDASPSIEHTCVHCGAMWDQDYNACANLLALATPPSGSRRENRLT